MNRLKYILLTILLVCCIKPEKDSVSSLEKKYTDIAATQLSSQIEEMRDSSKNIGLSPDQIVAKYGKANICSIAWESEKCFVKCLSYSNFRVSVSDTAEIRKISQFPLYARSRNPNIYYVFIKGKCCSIGATQNH